jgi:DNA integrity scanning protein DisA with diadenylate cyclase activity
MKKIGNAEKLMMQMAELVTPKIRDDEFTSNDFIEKTNMAPRTARQFLQDQVNKGVLKSRKINHNGVISNAYSDATGAK